MTTITAIASTNSWDGRIVTLIFAGVLQITHSANLALPGSANITTAANDVAVFIQTGSGAWRLANYQSSSVGLGPFLQLTGGTLTGALISSAGSAAAPGVGVGEAATGLYRIGAGQLGISIGGTLSASWSANRNLSIAAPVAGVTLALANIAGQFAQTHTSAGASSSSWSNTADSVAAYFGVDSATGFTGTSTNHDFKTFTNNTVKMVVTADGRHYGTALHNNAGSLTGTTNQYAGHSGTYTPTLTGVSNVDSATPGQFNWIRDGNAIMVVGSLSLDPTAGSFTATSLRISLPIASDLAADDDLSGLAVMFVAGASDAGRVVGDTVNNAASLLINVANTASQNVRVFFMYEVL